MSGPARSYVEQLFNAFEAESGAGPEELAAWILGFDAALDAFGIWKDGEQWIGAVPRTRRSVREELDALLAQKIWEINL